MLIVAYWQESERNAKCLCFDNRVCSAVTNHHVDMWQQLQLRCITFDNAVGREDGFKFISAEFVDRKDELYVHALQGLVCSNEQLCETNKKTVPIEGEVEFMRNYIDLMRLRCNDKTEVTTTFDIKHDMDIAPLLFISLIENAFKHGVSSNRPSMIDIRLLQNSHELIFYCENTNFPKDDTDRSGSGIGLENTRRRLELMYENRYTWEQSVDDDIYHVKITLKEKV